VLHFNITAGLLIMGPSLLYADNGTGEGRFETISTENVWVYEPLVLVVVYAVAAAVDLVAIGVGVWAMMGNEGTGGFEFERIVAVMRGLGVVIGRWEDGLDPVPEVVEKTRVRCEIVMGGEVVGSLR
jgi:hypothetical protein